MTDFVTVRGVTKTYTVGDGSVEVLRGVDLALDRGRSYALTGPSGSGKSTLLAIIGSLETASSGTVEIDGVNLGALSERQRATFRARHLGFVFQSYNLLPHLNAVENIVLPMEFRSGGLRGRAARRRAEALLADVGLSHRASARAGLMSGGEQQRVAVARALANEPGLVLADEPTGNLDSENGQMVMNALTRVTAEGGTLLLVTHDDAIAHAADHVVRLGDGLVKEVEGGRTPRLAYTHSS